MRISLAVGATALLMIFAVPVFAVPETVGARIADVTTSACSLVWLTDVAAVPDVEVYADSAMTSRLTDSVKVAAYPHASSAVIDAARQKGVMKVRVAGLRPSTTYYLRSVTADPSDPLSVSYSPLLEVKTAAAVQPYRVAADGSLQGFANDLVSMRVYIRPGDASDLSGLGDLILLESPGASCPVSAFVGTGVAVPSGVIDLNNLFDHEALSMMATGGEAVRLTIYRGGALATMVHFRRLPSSEGAVGVVEPPKGFFADINLDGRVDEADFAEFLKYYRTGPNDATYNPDYDFVEDETGIIDARDFSRFAREYGRTNVP